MKRELPTFVDNHCSLYEACEYYRIPEGTLIRWINQGHLRATRRKIVRDFGRLVWAITKEEFDRLPALAEEMVKQSRGLQKFNLERRRASQEKRKADRRDA